jgi:hypothetical protein
MNSPQPRRPVPEPEQHPPATICHPTGTTVPADLSGTWRIRDHEHRQQITARRGDTLPACMLCGRPVTWCFVR